MKDIKKNHGAQLWISCAIHTGVFRMDIQRVHTLAYIMQLLGTGVMLTPQPQPDLT